MVKEIEKSILIVVHNMRFTTNQLAVINILYNAQDSGLTIKELTPRMIETKRKNSISGILSQLAQIIDKLENPGDKYGFTGYILFFERFNGELHKIRPEFRHVIDQHDSLRNAMQVPVEQLYVDYKNGLKLQ